jgi:hypothetical protein
MFQPVRHPTPGTIGRFRKRKWNIDFLLLTTRLLGAAERFDEGNDLLLLALAKP